MFEQLEGHVGWVLAARLVTWGMRGIVAVPRSLGRINPRTFLTPAVTVTVLVVSTVLVVVLGHGVMVTF